MDITEVSILHHIGIVFILLWILSYFNWCHPFVYFISFIYLFLVNERYTLRLRKRLQFEERKQANQRRLLSDSETVRWLNHAVEKIWPICMEEIASQKFLLPIIPWFLDKYKPWTAKKAVVQNLYLGRNPPMFTEIRVTSQSADDDHLVLELGMNFLSADDMSAVLAVKLRKRLGFGMWAKMHITGMHVEGKVLVGVKFLRQWPFLSRVRVCFVEPPYFQMTVKPIFNHGVDVTELPGIAGWLDKILAVAFEQTLVEPNMLVVDVEKFATKPSETWFCMDEKRPIAFAKVEILEAADMKPSDPNGLADPYVKGQLGPYRFRTKTKKKTLAPRWQEEFKIPICTWESPNVLHLEVRDKDHFLDDTLGDSSVNISEMRGGLRHDKWLALQNIKMGRLHVAITVVDVDEKEGEQLSDPELAGKRENTSPEASEAVQKVESAHGIDLEQVPPKIADQFEPINIEGQQRTGVWVHHPGNEIPTSWEPRKGRTRHPETQLYREGNGSIDSPRSLGFNPEDSSTDEENLEGKSHPVSSIRNSLRKLSSVFRRSPKSENSSDIGSTLPTPRANIRAVGEKGTSVRVVMDDIPKTVKDPNIDADEARSPGKSHQMKGMAKSILKQAGKSAHDLKHALNRKSSQKSKGVSLPEMSEKEKYQDSESTDESIPSSKDTPRSEGDLVVSATPFDSHKESSEAEETDRVRQMDYARSMVESQLGNESFKCAQSANASTNMVVPEESLDRRVSFRGLDNLSAPNDEQEEVEGPPLPNVGEEKLEGEK